MCISSHKYTIITYFKYCRQNETKEKHHNKTATDSHIVLECDHLFIEHECKTYVTLRGYMW